MRWAERGVWEGLFRALAAKGRTTDAQMIDSTHIKAHRSAYRGHNAPSRYKFRVYTAGQKRRMTPEIKRQMRRRSAVEPVIGHLKAEHRMGRNYLAHHAGDAANVVLAAFTAIKPVWGGYLQAINASLL